MELSNLIHFIAASVVLTLLPGPDILFVIAQSISQGRKAGIAIALGLCSGVTFHTLAAAMGISVILYQSSIAFHILKYAGAIYLLYLAWQAFRESNQPLLVSDSSISKQNLFSLFKKGIFMNVLNPKVSLFFLAFLPQFVSPEAGNISVQMMILGLVFMLQAIIIFTAVAVLSGIIGNKWIANPRVNKSIHLAKAGFFAIIGIRLALAEK